MPESQPGMRARWAIHATVLAVAATWNVTAHAGEKLGSEWWVQLARTNGKEIQQDGDVITLTGPGPEGKDLRICQTEIKPISGRFLVRGEWSYADIDPIESWQGARPYLMFYDANGQPLTQGKGRHGFGVGKGSHPSASLDSVVEPPEEAAAARWCMELIGTKSGSASIRGLEMQAMDANSPGEGKNVLVLVVDTLRADALGVHGQKLPITRNLDALASKATVFDRAWTQYTWTVPSTISLFLSQYQRTHGWNSTFSLVAEGKYTEMPTETSTLAQVLQGAGYLTLGYCANPLLKAGVGIGRGFYDWEISDDPGVVEKAVADIERWDHDGMPNFLYVHLMAPHVPLRPSDAAIKATKLKVAIPPEGFRYYGQIETTVPEPAYNDQFKDVYYAAVYDADASIGKVLAALEKSGHADDTLVIFTSDHGENVGEHGLVGHGSNVLEGLTHVPLIVRDPGRKATVVKDRVGQAIDVAPTILEWLDMKDQQPAGWQGISLFADAPGRLAVSERDNDIAFMSTGATKVIAARGSGELRHGYDLRADPGESSPLPASDKKVVALHTEGLEWREETPMGDPTGLPAVQRSQAEIDETSEALKALGYVDE